MHEKVLRHIRERSLLRVVDRVLVAVSGGADSVALLRVLLELHADFAITLAVAHFNHGLRGEESAADEAFVADLAKQHGLEFFVHRADIRQHALSSKASLEAAGRAARYRWFGQVAEQQRFDCIATAHTLDDQAETVLLKFLRGAGTRGLAGIYPVVACGNARIVRPLLCVTRVEVEAYLSSLGQTWREDQSNLDTRYLRNRVRHELLPLLEDWYNPNIRECLRNAAEIAEAEEEYWAALAQGYVAVHADSDRLRLEGFDKLPLALQRRVLKAFAEHTGAALDFAHLEKLRRVASGRLRATALPRERMATREKGALKLGEPRQREIRDYEYVLPIPGEVYVPEFEGTVRALVVAEEFARERPRDTLLQRALLAPQLRLRNWRSGDRYLPTHRKSEHKLKRLFAEQRVHVEKRGTWPVVLNGEEIVWVRTMPVAAAFEWKGAGDAVLIEVVPAVTT